VEKKKLPQEFRVQTNSRGISLGSAGVSGNKWKTAEEAADSYIFTEEISALMVIKLAKKMIFGFDISKLTHKHCGFYAWTREKLAVAFL
jgi:hypothetical protein